MDPEFISGKAGSFWKYPDIKQNNFEKMLEKKHNFNSQKIVLKMHEFCPGSIEVMFNKILKKII